VRVLVVDDEVRLAEAVARGLRAEGFDVEISHDGLDALWLAKEREYAAIVLDLLLPWRAPPGASAASSPTPLTSCARR